MSKADGTIKSDSGYHFVIMIGILSQSSDSDVDGFYYHSKFSMAIESKIRSFLVHLDSILNPSNDEFRCLIRPYPKLN